MHKYASKSGVPFLPDLSLALRALAPEFAHVGVFVARQQGHNCVRKARPFFFCLSAALLTKQPSVLPPPGP